VDQYRDPRLLRLCRLAFAFVFSAALGFLAPVAAEALSSPESLEDELHAGTRTRARLVRCEVSPRVPGRVEPEAPRRQPRRATADRFDRSVVRVRKIPSLISDSPTALPDH
jgi:hypothetical protein